MRVRRLITSAAAVLGLLVLGVLVLWPTPRICGSDLGDPACRAEAAALMRERAVPALAVAVLANGVIVSVDVFDQDGADLPEDTAFQAASLSKPVAAAVALAYLEPDETLQALLSHSARMGAEGFGGYPAGADLPTTQQILDGQPPATNAPITEGAALCAYSGGGYVRVQAMVEAAAGTDFAAAAAPVLARLNMAHSGFGAAPDRAIAGHDAAGRPLEGGWRLYPERAAAGLWTTARDYADFVLYLAQSAQVEPVACGYGLGPHVAGNHIWHDGVNIGYRARFAFNLREGNGVVVLTNAENGFEVIGPLIAGIARDRGWDLPLE